MNTCIFLTIRINSIRLPKKALLEINGETVTEILIKRLQKTKIPIVVCTTTEPEDERYLKPIADKYGLGCHEAPAGNIISQHADCCKQNNVSYVLLSEIDDWLICPETINAVYRKASELKFKKAIRTEGLPFGMNVIAYPAENLNVDFSSSTNWGVHVTKDAHVLKFNYDRPYKLSTDTVDDFETMRDIYLNCKRNELVGGIIRYMDKNKEEK